MRIETEGPSPEPIVKPIEFSFVVPPDSALQGRYLHLVYNIENISLPAEGDYAFNVVIDESRCATLPLSVVHVTGPLTPSEVENALIAEGVRAFADGDIDGAEAAFREATERFSTLPTGHNNLGFILLHRGDGERAKQAFLKARELGYQELEFNLANVGCAEFLLGKPGEAFKLFQECLRARVFTMQGILFGISASGLFPLSLYSASDYAALMSLNAAWSAHRSGDPENATHYLRAAQAAEVMQRLDEGARRFAESVASLAQTAKRGGKA